MAEPNSLSLDDEVDVNRKITLVSQDDQRFTVPLQVATVSNLVQISFSHDALEKELRVNIKGGVLAKIVEYMVAKDGKETFNLRESLSSADISENCEDKFDGPFIEDVAKEREDLYNLLLAANYMDIPGLVRLACARVACFIKKVKKADEVQSALLGDKFFTLNSAGTGVRQCTEEEAKLACEAASAEQSRKAKE